ncbi:TonB-dependent receptor [Sphingomonas sp. BIUV-7]|uniref:TonB-dependent receptor n=1 Tax=Sphingomonas natans TaxID=3063330 RepID=A0ABT8Y8J2_9SPHN|nr:TonB-dependent receptor [Sphingomonas sp. BIUV-7]MDO6414634.1 TonB-dependent receptor [Sphingomonas sp. BIUV-7]
MIDHRLLATTTIFAVAAAGSAYAQARPFDIAAKPVTLALVEFGKQADVQIVAARRLTDGKQANAVRGTMTVPVALDRLISGTGLAAKQTSNQTYALASAEAAASPQTASSAEQPATPVDPAPSDAATASRPASDEQVADIVVTGSSIRGTPPTGSNLIQLGRDDIIQTGATTTQELLATVPQLASFNTAPRPGQRSNSSLSTGPDIRGIGQSATLTLVNGHRIVGVGALSSLPDPSMVPPSAIQRVEIVADGASATYGSDGVAGVVNVITRRDYDGVEGTIRSGFGSNYHLLNGNASAGKKWDGGGIIISGEYSATSRLRASTKPFLTNDFSGTGGQDLRIIGNSCIPATYRTNNAAGVATGSFIQPATGAVDPRCTTYQYGDLYPKQERLSFFASGHQEVTDGVELGFDSFYSRTKANAYNVPSFTSGVMTRSNPFFPAGLPATVTSITTYFNPQTVTGIPLLDHTTLTTYGGTLTSDVTLPHDFKWSTYLTGSRSNTDIHEASFNPRTSTALLAGTTRDTALDPFGTGTSATNQITLADYENHYVGKQYLWELNSKIDGSLITLPAGDLKVAIGGVYRTEHYNGLFATGRIGFDEGAQRGVGTRKVYSGFGELFIPLFSQQNALPMLQLLNISLSGRIDHYNDFGSTKNPKIGVNWAPVNGITLRGTYGKSFHAPALNDLYSPDTRAGYLANGTLPPGLPQGSVPGGIFIAGGDPNLGPERAETWSLGADFQPSFLPGFKASVTYYNLMFKDRISTPSRTFYTDPNFRKYIVDNIVCGSGTYPSGTNCQARPLDPNVVWDLIKDISRVDFPNTVNGPADLPPIYNVTLLRRTNLSVIKTDGLDFDVGYRWQKWDTTFAAQAQGNYVLNFNQAAAAGAALVDQFPLGQQRLRVRGTLSGQHGPLSVSASVNYSGKYRNRFTTFAGPLATETISSFTTVEMHFGLKLPDQGMLSGMELTADIDNLFDTEPSYMQSSNGYGVGNILGRVVTLGLRKRF